MADDSGKKLIEFLSSDLRSLSSESKKKYPQVKDAAETGLVKVRNILTDCHSTQQVVHRLKLMNQDVLHPFLMACNTRQTKLVQISLQAIQRLVAASAIDIVGFRNSSSSIVNELWSLMEAECEELKVLQSISLLVTANDMITGSILARCIVMCFRLHFAKDPCVINTASASVRQLVNQVFERLNTLPACKSGQPTIAEKPANLGSPKQDGTTSVKQAPTSLTTAGADAFMLFQDICVLVNGERPQWLIGITDMTRTLGLELLENTLSRHAKLFVNHSEFIYLVKDNVCPLVIKLFSPSLKFVQMAAANSRRGAAVGGGGAESPRQSPDRPYFPIAMRLLRVVAVLLTQYNEILTTECEIFLSLILKFLESDKLPWQRALALEVLHKIMARWQLLKAYCVNYDLRPNNTKLLESAVNGLASVIQLSFTPPTHQPMTMAGSVDSHGDVSDSSGDQNAALGQPGFLYRGIWQPLSFIAPLGVPKALLLELVDKHEAPELPNGYCLSLAYTCIVDATYGLQHTLNSESAESTVVRQLFSSSQLGILTSLSLLLEASTDENITETLLKCVSHVLHIGCALQANAVRDACICAICKTALPPNYIARLMTETDATNQTQSRVLSPQGSPLHDSDHQSHHHHASSSPAHQVVAVGTTCPMPNLPASMLNAQQMLTAKNLQAMRMLINIAQSNGTTLEASWNLTLATLQHLCWMLGLVPQHSGGFKTASDIGSSTSGSAKSSADSDANVQARTVLTTAVLADVPVISSMLCKLFDYTSELDEVSLHHVLAALCKLSNESMQVAATMRAPSYFACAQLLATGLVNMHRMNVFWKTVTWHLIEVCNQPFGRLREWGGVAVVKLVKTAINNVLDKPDEAEAPDYKGTQSALVLSVLAELCECMHEDVRLQQIEAVSQLLHEHAPRLPANLWPTVIRCIGAPVADNKFSKQSKSPEKPRSFYRRKLRRDCLLNVDLDDFGEPLVKNSFGAVNLLITDFIQLLSLDCVRQLVMVDAKFGQQQVELNISLSAVGQLWAISDFLYRSYPTRPASKELQDLWLVAYQCLGDLCLDSRPAVRKSACHTLLQTSTTHGNTLDTASWKHMLTQVLFPMLGSVTRQLCSASTTKNEAVNEKSGKPENLLIHHSRDTARKQWAETSTQTLSAVVKTVNVHTPLLVTIAEFGSLWSTLLSFLESSAISGDTEISLCALRSLHELILGFSPSNQAANNQPLSKTTNGERKRPVEPHKTTKLIPVSCWMNTWQVWLQIGVELTTSGTESQAESGSAVKGVVTVEPGRKPGDVSSLKTSSVTPQHVTVLLHSLVPLWSHVRDTVDEHDLPRLYRVLRGANAITPTADQAPFIMPIDNSNITPTQNAIVDIVHMMFLEMTATSSRLRPKLPQLYSLLLDFVVCTCHAPTISSTTQTNTTGRKLNQDEWLVSEYVPFGELCLKMLVECYAKTAHYQDITNSQVLTECVRVLTIPLALKYDCPSQSTWKQAISALMSILRLGLPIARKNAAQNRALWPEIANAFEKFLFPKSQPKQKLSPEERRKDEFTDCKVIELIRTELLPYTAQVPDEFVHSIIQILNNGSVNEREFSSQLTCTDSHIHARSDFVKACFEALLSMSQAHMTPDLVKSASQVPDGGQQPSTSGTAAITTLLNKCKKVISEYIEDERVSCGVPLTQQRVLNARNVLAALQTIINSTYNHQVTASSSPSKTSSTRASYSSSTMSSSCTQSCAFRSDLIEIYGLLVECVASKDEGVRHAVLDTLKCYKLLLTDPTHPCQRL